MQSPKSYVGVSRRNKCPPARLEIRPNRARFEPSRSVAFGFRWTVSFASPNVHLNFQVPRRYRALNLSSASASPRARQSREGKKRKENKEKKDIEGKKGKDLKEREGEVEGGNKSV